MAIAELLLNAHTKTMEAESEAGEESRCRHKACQSDTDEQQKPTKNIVPRKWHQVLNTEKNHMVEAYC